MEEERAIFSILEYIELLKKSNKYDNDNIDVALQCLSTAFNLDAADTKKKSELGLKQHSFADIFHAGCETLKICSDSYNEIDDVIIQKNRELWNKWVQKLNDKGFFQGTQIGSQEYKERMKKALQKFKEKFSSVPETDGAQISEEEKEKRAEEIKKKGNAAISTRDYVKAAELYEKAALLCPNSSNSHIYFANLAAAQIHLSQYEECIKNCEKAIKLNGRYVKAYSRMGAAYYHLREYDFAIDSYHRGLEVEVNNTACLDGLEEAENAKKSSETGATTNFSGSAQRESTPDFGSLAAMMGSGGGLAGLMSNPQMQQMAASMMQNPQMKQMAENLMSNPSAMNDMLKSFGQTPGTSTSGSQSAPRDQSGPSGLSNLLSPEGIRSLLNSPPAQELRKDPEMSEFFKDVDEKGPTGAMRHLGNPKIMAKLKTLIQ